MAALNSDGWKRRQNASDGEIGRILSISENTVVYHIKNAMKKLGTNTRTGAGVKVIQLGLIASSVEDDRHGAGHMACE